MASSSSSSSSSSMIVREHEDYVSLLDEHEREALREFKLNEVTRDLTDRRLMVFLFARKLNVDRAVTLLKNNLEFRRIHGIPINIERSQVNVKLLNSMTAYFIPGTMDKEHRAINYLMPSRSIPSEFTVAEYFTYMMYLADLSEWEAPEFHRKGLVIVEDLHGVEMKHMDSRIMKKEKGKPGMQDVFPSRIQAIYLLNPPFILRALTKIAKIFIKNKIMKRIKVVQRKEDLLEFFDKSQLHEHFGGDAKYPPLLNHDHNLF